MVKLKKEDRKKSPLNRGGRGDFREATFPGGIIGHPAGGGIDGGSLIGPLDSRCSYAGNFQFPTDRCRRRESRYLVTALGARARAKAGARRPEGSALALAPALNFALVVHGRFMESGLEEAD